MSNWKEIKDIEDVEISQDRKSLEVFIGKDENGNNYVEIPVSLIMQKITELTKLAEKPFSN